MNTFWPIYISIHAPIFVGHMSPRGKDDHKADLSRAALVEDSLRVK